MPKKQKNGLYRSHITVGTKSDGSPVYKYVSGRTKAELDAAKRETKDYYITGVGVQSDRLFGEYAIECFRTFKEPHLSPSSCEAYRVALNKRILPEFGDRNLRAIQPMELQAFVNTLAGKATTTITMVFVTLRGIFRAALADGIVARDPTVSLRKPAAKPPCEKRALTVREREIVTGVCVTHKRGAYLACMYYLGVRPGEARGLQWGDIDWDEGLVHIQRDIDYAAGGTSGALKTKNSNRFIPIPEDLRDILWSLRGLPSCYITSGESSHQPLAKTVGERLWVELMEACGMVVPTPPGKYKYRPGDIRSRLTPIITPHTLRHNYITMCWENGFDVYTTMKLVGHKSIKTTMDIYTHLSEAQMEKTKISVEAMFSPKQKLHKSCTRFEFR